MLPNGWRTSFVILTRAPSSLSDRTVDGIEYSVMFISLMVNLAGGSKSRKAIGFEAQKAPLDAVAS